MREVITMDIKKNLTNTQIRSLWREFNDVLANEPEANLYSLGYAERCCDSLVQVIVEVDRNEGKALMKMANPY